MTMTLPGSRHRCWLRAFATLALIALSFGHMGVPLTTAQSGNRVVWDEYNVDFVVNDDGTVRVIETQVVEFDGRFSTGFANIPMTGTEAITNVTVSIADSASEEPQVAEQVRFFNEEPGTYAVEENAGTLEIDYAYEPTSPLGSAADNTRVIVIEYELIGAIRVYEDLEPANQQLRWVAIETDVTEIAPIRSSTVTVTLPEPVDTAQTVARPEGVETDGQTFTWRQSNLDNGDRFEVNLQFPPITAAAKPAWQDRFDQIREQQITAAGQAAAAGTLFLGAGLLLLVGGSLLLAGLWYTRGRDPEVGLVADIVAEPPDDLRPGAAGTLIDEETHTRDVIATMFDLARRGIIHLDEKQTEGFMGFGRQTRYILTLQEHSNELMGYEQVLLDAIFGPNAEVGSRVPMEQVQQTFAARADTIHNGFYDELVEHGYFDASPEQTRQRARMLGCAGPILAAVVIFLVIFFTGASSGFIVLPILAAVVLFVIGRKVATNMPRKSLKGAEAAAKWRAFKRYLQEIEQHENLEESKAIFDRYLPYATAFGLEDSWIRKFSQVSTPMPDWFGGGFGGPVVLGQPGGYGRRGSPFGGGVWVFPSGGGSFGGGSVGGGSRGGDASGGGFDMPGMQDLSDSAGGSLQSGSDSIFDMLGTASEIFGGGGGRRGGGSFGSWGGGGGGFGGFSGGGGFGGGGGGGGRGFG